MMIQMIDEYEILDGVNPQHIGYSELFLISDGKGHWQVVT
jgi:hypothetical protein